MPSYIDILKAKMNEYRFSTVESNKTVKKVKTIISDLRKKGYSDKEIMNFLGDFDDLIRKFKAAYEKESRDLDKKKVDKMMGLEDSSKVRDASIYDRMTRVAFEDDSYRRHLMPQGLNVKKEIKTPEEEMTEQIYQDYKDAQITDKKIHNYQRLFFLLTLILGILAYMTYRYQNIYFYIGLSIYTYLYYKFNLIPKSWYKNKIYKGGKKKSLK